MSAQGDFFDPDDQLERHVQAEHGGEVVGTCDACRRLCQAILESGETYAFSGTGPCRYCGLELLWFKTPTGSRMPVDRELFFEAHPNLAPNALRGFWTTSSRGAKLILPFNHWTTCPHADKAREAGVEWYEEDPGPLEDSKPASEKPK